MLSPAKINLILHIGPRLFNGYHLLETLMVPLSWGDEIGFKIKSANITKIKVDVSGLKLKQGENLATQAAESFAEAFGINFDLKIRIKKKIPTGAGLGGGSSNAAAVLKYLEKWASKKRRISKRKLHKIARKLGADVPFFLDAKSSWCTGVGEVCKPVQLKKLHLVLVLSKKGIPTSWAYRTLDQDRVNQRVSLHGKPSWLDQNYEIPVLENNFEATVLKRRKDLQRTQKLIALSGAQASRMSGSGATFFGLYSSAKDARKGARYLARKGLKVVVTRTC